MRAALFVPAAVLAAAALVLGLAASLAGGTAVETRKERLLFVEGDRLRTVAPGGGTGQPVGAPKAGISAPAWSPDGMEIVFAGSASGNSDLFAVHADGTGLRPIAATPLAEVDPAWAPDGKSIAYAVENRLIVQRLVDGRRRRLVTVGAAVENPTWSPDGARIAFSVSRADGTAHLYVVRAAGGPPVRITDGVVADRDPAWSPGGRLIAFVRRDEAVSPLPRLHVVRPDGSELRPVLEDGEPHADPAWAPRGNRVAFSRGVAAASEIFTVGLDGSSLRRQTANDVPDLDPDWASVPTKRELLPDFDQRAPSNLSVAAQNGRFKLGFTSATDNIGVGPIWLRGVRPVARGPMEATQLIRLAGGGVRSIRDVGRMQYTIALPHEHFHVLRFQNYELRRADDFALLATDRKSGFCLADHYGLARERVRSFRSPRFLGNCGQKQPDLLAVEQGTSVGYTDRYPAYFHGQNVDVTGVPAGLYWLVHRANLFGRLRELDYTNNAASVLIRLSWPNGRRASPKVDLLRRCEEAERC